MKGRETPSNVLGECGSRTLGDMNNRVALHSSSLLLLAALGGGCIVGEPDTPSRLRAGTPSLYGINAAGDGTASDVVSDLGARWVRLELVDHSSGTAMSAPTAERFGTTLDDYRARGINVLVIVDYASLGGFAGFGTSGACGDWGAWRAAWLARVGWAAETFGSKIDAWEIWNEPDHPIAACGAGYNPGIPPAEYGRLLGDARHVIRDAGANGAIVVGGLDSGNLGYVHAAAAATGGLQADGIGVHPYGVVPDASWCPNPGEDLVCEWGTLGGKIDQYFAASGLPVWITEFGLKTEDSQHAAGYVTAAYEVFASKGARVGPAFVFCESDAMVAPFGLTYADHSPKPFLYDAYKALTGAAAGEPEQPGGGEEQPADALTSKLHGRVHVGTRSLAGIAVTAWGHAAGDFHSTTTDAAGIYELVTLDPKSKYNLVVNGQFVDGEFVAIDPAHAVVVRDNIELEAGPDGWHGENFPLAY